MFLRDGRQFCGHAEVRRPSSLEPCHRDILFYDLNSSGFFPFLLNLFGMREWYSVSATESMAIYSHTALTHKSDCTICTIGNSTNTIGSNHFRA